MPSCFVVSVLGGTVDRLYDLCDHILQVEAVSEILESGSIIVNNDQEIETICLDITEGTTIRVTDEEAKDIIKRVSRCENASEFQTLEIKKRDKYLKKLRERGLSIRQISRLTGVSFNVVRKF